MTATENSHESLNLTEVKEVFAAHYKTLAASYKELDWDDPLVSTYDPQKYMVPICLQLMFNFCTSPGSLSQYEFPQVFETTASLFVFPLFVDFVGRKVPDLDIHHLLTLNLGLRYYMEENGIVVEV